MIYFISLLEIASVVIHDVWMVFCEDASIADNGAVIANCIKTFLAVKASTFFINGKPTCAIGLRNSPSWALLF